ncbi:MAG: serine protease [Parcubacteria group bacterium]
MLLKEILSYILAPAILFVNTLFGNPNPNTAVYVAPETPKVQTIEKATSTKETKNTSVDKSTPVKNSPKTTSQLPPKPTENPTTTPPVAQEPTPNFEQINTFARQAVVNILCTTNGKELSPISGTGIVVKPDGLIITNAHVGQYLLLKDFTQNDFVECVVRTGSPAYPRYNVELVYISPSWIADNKTILKEQNPQGTGENDFAFLRITKSIDNSKLPDKFHFLQMNVRESISIGEPVLLASYPAGFLGGLSILQNLNVASSITTIRDYFTFKKDTIDLISVPGTVISQKGSSGGAVVDKYTSLLALISTSSEGKSTEERDLRAITMSFVNRELKKEIDISLDQFVNIDSATFARKFQEVSAPILTKILTDELLK